MDRDFERAVRVHGAADAIKATSGALLSAPEQFIVGRYLAPAAAALPEEVREAARAEGLAMSLDQAIAYALDETAAP
jgi:hypothetical protein